MGKVTKIPANLVKGIKNQSSIVAKKRVCGYARVSTEEEEQQNSYKAQCDYYTNFIKSHAGWEFAGLYSDEGISGTQTKHRAGFNKMIEDALAGKIDLIVTKSVSRFARNTVDTLNAIRQLKDKKVEVYFEKENIYTLDSKGEVLLTIMGSLAQEESRSISENTLWGVRKKMERGEFTVPYSRFMGYDQGPEGKLIVNKEQAEIVRLIFRLYLYGYQAKSIARILQQRGIKTVSGKTKWLPTTINKMLENEKYKGDARLQKTYVSNYLTKKVSKNNGDLAQFYIENDHEAIIDKDTFDLVQLEIEKRKHEKKVWHGNRSGPFRDKVLCGDCNEYLSRKVFHSNDERYRQEVFVCPEKHVKITETTLKENFIKAMNQVIGNKKVHIENAEIALDYIKVKPAEQKEKENLEKEIDKLNTALTNMIKINAKKAQSQKRYKTEYGKIALKLEEKQKEYDKIKSKIEFKNAGAVKIRTYINEIKKATKVVKDFDDVMFMSFIDKVLVFKNKITFTWKNGTQTEVQNG